MKTWSIGNRASFAASSHPSNRTVYTGTIRRIDHGVAYVQEDGEGATCGVRIELLHAPQAYQILESGPRGVRWTDVCPRSTGVGSHVRATLDAQCVHCQAKLVDLGGVWCAVYSDELGNVKLQGEQVFVKMRDAGRVDLMHYAASAHRDVVAWYMCSEWEKDPSADEATLKSRALKQAYNWDVTPEQIRAILA